MLQSQLTNRRVTFFQDVQCCRLSVKVDKNKMADISGCNSWPPRALQLVSLIWTYVSGFGSGLCP